MLHQFIRISIRSKIFLAFAVVLAGTVGLGVFSQQRLAAVNATAAEVANNQLPRMRLLGDIAYQLANFRQLEAAYILAPDPESRATEAAKLRAVQEDADKSMRSYVPLIDPGREAQLFSAAKQAYSAYLALHETLLALADGNDQARAAALYRGELRESAIALRSQERALIEFNMEEARISASRGAYLSDLSQTGILAGLGVMIMLCVLMGWSMVHGISRPLTSMTATMRRMADHDLTTEIVGHGRGDEIGAMAAALQVLRDNISQADRLGVEQASAQAAKGRRQTAMERHTRDFGAAVAGVMTALVASAEGMRNAAIAMAEAAGGVRDQASTTAAGSRKSSERLASVAAAIQQMTSRVDEISRQVAVAAQVTREAVGQADASRETLKSLTEATLRIGDVVQLINDIAGQTNLLALNATIEAERAGEVGRDFAVVAGEVKALATQTGSATQEIGGQIEAVRSAASESISAIGEVACIIGRLDEVTAMIAAALEEQSAAAREIAASLQAVSSASSEATAAMQHVVSGSDEASAVSQQVLESASNIGVEAERLRGEVDQFLIAVRDEASNRRRYERLPGNGAMAMLATCDGAAMSVVIQDISRGGIAVACDWPLPAGSEVTIGLQGAGGVLYARTVRSGGGVLALVFQQDTDTLAKIDRVLPRFEAMRRAA